MPGPGNYQVPDSLSRNGGSWSFYSPKSEIEELQARAADLPGPGEYEIKGVANGIGKGVQVRHFFLPVFSVMWEPETAFIKNVHGVYTVQFSDANPKSALERYIYENKDTPGPGAWKWLITSPSVAAGQLPEECHCAIMKLCCLTVCRCIFEPDAG